MPRGSRTLADSRKPTAPPYNPGYGVDPPFLVGRRDILDSIEEALTTGPRSPWFGHGLVGDRGVGKTVLLNAMQQLAAAKGWAVVAEQAVPDQPLLEPLLGQIVSVAGSRWTKLSKLAKEVDLELSLGLDVKVARAEAHFAPGRRLQPAHVVIRRVLTAVGECRPRAGSAS